MPNEPRKATPADADHAWMKYFKKEWEEATTAGDYIRAKAFGDCIEEHHNRMHAASKREGGREGHAEEKD